VPNEVSKSSMVEAQGNILIDDSNKNLEEWDKSGGISLYYGNRDSLYTRITSIEDAIRERIKKTDDELIL